MTFAPVTVGSYVCPSRDGAGRKSTRALEERLAEERFEYHTVKHHGYKQEPSKLIHCLSFQYRPLTGHRGRELAIIGFPRMSRGIDSRVTEGLRISNHASIAIAGLVSTFLLKAG